MDLSPHVDGAGTCALCATADTADARYCRHAVAGLEQRRHCSEAIAATLGYCASHAELIETADEQSEFAALYAAAAARLVDRFEREPDFTRTAVFDAQHACPACQWRDRHVGREAHRWLALAGTGLTWPPLCIDHLHTAIGIAPQGALQPLLAQQGEQLRGCADIARVAGSPRSARRWRARMCRLLAERRFEQVADLFDAPALCPVCGWIAQTIERWIDSVRTAVRIGADGETVFPLCAGHVWIAADECGDAAAAIAAHAAAAVCRSLAAGLQAIQRDERADAEARASVWYRRRSPAYVLGQWRRGALRMPACLPCLLAATALEFAVEAVVDVLGSTRQRGRLERGHGLCMKHFAYAALLAPRGSARDALIAMQTEKLRALAGQRSAAVSAHVRAESELPAGSPGPGTALSHLSAAA
jgi:hypothetical protein